MRYASAITVVAVATVVFGFGLGASIAAVILVFLWVKSINAKVERNDRG